MRVAASLLTLSLAASPVLAAAQYAPAPPRPAPGRPPDDAAQPPPPSRPAPPYARGTPAPPPYARPAPDARPSPYARPAPPRYAYRAGQRAYVGAVPFWAGMGWGWGYYALYPRSYAYSAQPYAPAGGYAPEGYGPDGYAPPGYGPQGYPPGYYDAEADRVHLRLGGTVAGTDGGVAGGFNVAVDSRLIGFNVSVDGLRLDGVTNDRITHGDALGWGSAHVTWSVLADAFFRVRLEMGGSMLSMPRTGAFATATRGGQVAFGPDMGISGQLGLVGPLGFEGHFRVTPMPVTVTDAALALAFRGGPFALTAGWRGIHVYQDGVKVPEVDFSGPEVGLAFQF